MSPTRFTILLFAILNCGLPASAQTLEDRLRDQLRQTTEQLRQMQDGQAALQAQKVAAEQERDALKKQVAALQAQTAHPQRDKSAELVLQAQIAKDRDALSQAASSVQEAQADHSRLQATVTNQATMLSACQQKNAQLFAVSNEILDRFQHVGWQDALNLSEPFAQGARVDLENIAQDYGDKIYDGKFDPRTVKKGPAAPVKTAPVPDQSKTNSQPPTSKGP